MIIAKTSVVPIAIAAWIGVSAAASAADVSPFLDVDAAACAKLDDINLQVGPPDAEIVAACSAVMRGVVWSHRFAGGPGAIALAVSSIVLVYLVLGAPMRSFAGLMRRSTARPAAAMSIAVALGLLLRAAFAVVSMLLLSLPYSMAAAGLAVLALTIQSLRPPRAPPVEPEGAAPPPPSSLILADSINDVAAAAPGILALALLLRRDPWWLFAAMALAIVASSPGVIAARRRLRRNTPVRLVATATLSALVGAAALTDPEMTEVVGDAVTPILVNAIIFGAIALSIGWMRLERTRPNPGPG